MRKLVVMCVLLSLASGLTACGSDKKAEASPAGDTAPDTSKGAGNASSAQRTETIAAVACLSRFTKRLKGAKQYGQPAVAGLLPTRNIVVLTMYGPKGGARAGEARLLKDHPNYEAYNSADDKILVFFARKVVPGSAEFKAGDTCQRQAAAAG